MPNAVTIRAGNIRIRIFPCRNGRYVRWEFRYRLHDRRPRKVRRATLAEARKEAKHIAENLARGHHQSELSLADLASFRAGVINLFGTGKTLELATAEYAAAYKLIASTLSNQLPNFQLPSLLDLARAWLDARRLDNSCLTLPIGAIVETFIDQLKTRGLSSRHQEDLRARLRKYALDNACPTPQHTAATVQAWVLGLEVAPRTRNNYLAAVQTLFADALMASHPHGPAIRLIKPSVLGNVLKVIWTPEEMTKLLTTAARFDAPLVPLLALGGFAKLRASEAVAMRAADLRLDDAQAILQSGKTGSRLIPLPENCIAWLRAYAPKDGPLWSMSVDAYNAHLRRLARRCEVTWRPNALRKSAQLYAILQDPDYARISREAGNSPKMMRAHYVDPNLATKADAERWFAILPPKSEAVIIPLEQNA